MKPRDQQQQQGAEPEAMENKENTCRVAPPLRRPHRKRKALAELPNNASPPPPRASKPRTRSVVRGEESAEDAKKRGDLAGVTRPLVSKQPDAGAAQAAVVPYVGDIDRYLRSLEVEPLRRPRADYVGAIQKDINANMRALLVDWLVDVADEFKLLAHTLFLGVSYVDRFLTASVISRDKLQLLGVASLFIAAKYEEINPPKVNKLSDITDGTYTNHQVVKMEADILKFLNFGVGSPTVITFVRRFIASHRGCNCASANKLEFMSSYLAELSLLDYECIRFLPSVVAAACLFVARSTIIPKTRPWNLTLQGNTGYKVSDLKSCILRIHDLQLGRKYPDLKASRNKYSDRKFGCVSKMASPEEISASFLKDLTEEGEEKKSNGAAAREGSPKMTCDENGVDEGFPYARPAVCELSDDIRVSPKQKTMYLVNPSGAGGFDENDEKRLRPYARKDASVHCFPQGYLGLYCDRDLIISPHPTRNPRNYTMVDYNRFLRGAFGLCRDQPAVLGEEPRMRPRMLIISRSGTRKLLNMDEVVAAASELGFNVTAAQAVADVPAFAALAGELGGHAAGGARHRADEPGLPADERGGVADCTVGEHGLDGDQLLRAAGTGDAAPGDWFALWRKRGRR